MTNLDSILKSRDITLLTKFHIVNAIWFFSSHVWMWELDHRESWAPKNDVSQLWCWRRLLRVPWTARRSNQSILKEISPEYSLEGLMLKLQYFGHLMRRTDSLERPWCWERLKARGKGDDTASDSLLASSTQWTWVWASCGSWWWTGRPGMLHPWGCKELDMTERVNWTELPPPFLFVSTGCVGQRHLEEIFTETKFLSLPIWCIGTQCSKRLKHIRACKCFLTTADGLNRILWGLIL